MALNIPFRNAYYRFASSYSFLFFISWSLWWSLYAIWLKGHLGLTGTELGTLYSVNQFTSILFMMFYGIVQDKLGLKKPLIWCMSFILVLTGPFMIYVYEPLLQSNFSVGLILVKDHRTGYEAGNINAVMDGDLDGFINAYLKMESLEKLEKKN